MGLFAVGYGSNVSTPLLGLYRDRLSLGDSQTQAIFTVYVAGILGTLFVSGPLSDRYGRRITCVPFVVLSAMASLFLLVGRDRFIMLLVGRFLLGVVSGAVLSIGSAWMNEVMGKGNELKAALLTTLVIYFGFGFGPASSGILEYLFASPLVLPFVVHAAFTAAVIPLLLTVPETHQATDTPLRVQFGVPPEAKHTFWRLIVPSAVWVFGFPSASFALFPVLLREAMEGFDVTVAAASGAFTAWAAVLARPVLARLGERRALSVGMWAGSVGYVLGAVAFSTDAWPLLLPAAVLLGAASAVITASCLTLVGQLARPEKRGALTSTFWLLAYSGMVMPLFITSMAGLVGSTAVVLAGVTAVAATFAMWVTFETQNLGER